MLELGYMAKRISRRPEWLNVPSVADIYSVSGCVSEDFCDYVEFWKHNGHWFFNSPNEITSLAAAEQVDLSGTILLFYLAHHLQFDDELQDWTAFSPDDSIHTRVIAPAAPVLLGFDVVSYSMQNMPECSPLSCNHLASKIPVNEHCLIESLDEAIGYLEGGCFDKCEPGPYRIIAVHAVKERQTA